MFLITSEMVTDALNGGQTHKQILDQINAALAERPMVRVAYNKCYGGYGISLSLAERAGLEPRDQSNAARTNPTVIQAIETDPHSASGFCAKLAIALVPEGAHWRIEEYDGNETVLW